ncbi:uncharacterized protein [Diadema setosum]|uniref:uncharacterized protein n=1 Tax=Diadema setosum TaxID=31175 RepID=UPI003B3ADBD7
MTTHDHGDHHGCCAHLSPTPSVTQTLDEMDWERGLWSAALTGDLTRVKCLISGGCDVNSLDKSGYTALHYACRNGHGDIAATLLHLGANPNIQTRSGGATPLHRAAYGGHGDIVTSLLRNKADCTLRDSDGMTALHKAAEKGSVEICELLIRASPDLLTVEDNRGHRAIDYAKDNPKLSRMLSR